MKSKLNASKNEAKVEEKVTTLNEPIAIIGMGCRFPGGANDPYLFWENIISGVDSIRETPSERWNVHALYSSHKNKKGKLISKWGGYIDGFDEFDPSFFGITPREAELMDPQQRKLLEVTWEALEDGGQKPGKLAGSSIGVFVGGFTLDYKIVQFTSSDFANLDSHTATGVMMTMLSNRISYVFDFNGPSLSVDTACSSSLVAVNLACKSLYSGECNMALAGGVLLHLAPQYTIAESKGGFLSPTGWSHALDASANGYVRAEGVGVVLLKRLSNAIADRDPIHALILSTAVNQDGKTSGITVPSSEAQFRLMQGAYQKAGVNPGTVRYIELHGTGTPVGDPIEANSVAKILSQGRKPGEKCYAGSVKTNIGHAEAASGIAGLIKTIMILKNRQIPPHLHFQKLNPAIDAASLPFEVPVTLTDWPEEGGTAVAGVNSFGFGGTNAHIVLQEYRSPTPKANNKAKLKGESDALKVFPITARNSDVLPGFAKAYADFLDDPRNANLRLEDVAFTAAIRRERHDCRLSVLYSTPVDLREKLRMAAESEAHPHILIGRTRPSSEQKLVWVFTGMGPQWWAMGRELYHSMPVYRETIDRCDAKFAELADWSLKEELLAEKAASNMAENWLSQPANFALQIALSALWRSFGCEPDVIVGHSTGEIAAFYEAGVYTLEEAVMIAIHRSRLQELTSGTGKIAAVGLSEAEIQPLLKPYGNKISIAAINSFKSVSIAGDEAAMRELMAPLEKREVFCKFLKVTIPYHSAYMEPIKDDLLRCLQSLKPKKARIPLYSTVTGGRVDGAELDNGYWWKNVRETVRYAKAINQIIVDGFSNFLEIGPHPVLGGSIQDCLESAKKTGTILPSIRRNENEQERMLMSFAALHNIGIPIDWSRMHPDGNFVRLPRYFWKNDRFLTEPAFFKPIREGKSEHVFLGRRPIDAKSVWETELSIEKLPYLTDHCIQENIVFPAAGYIEMFYAATFALYGKGAFCLEQMQIEKAIFLKQDEDTKVRVIIDEENNTFRIHSLNENDTHGPVVHVRGEFRAVRNTEKFPEIDLEAIKARLGNERDAGEIYPALRKLGYTYGPAFQGLRSIRISDQEILSQIELPDSATEDTYLLHPSLLDACFQTVVVSELDSPQTEGGGIRLPVFVKSIRLEPGAGRKLWCYARLSKKTPCEIASDIYIFDSAERMLGSIEGFTARNVNEVVGEVKTAIIDKWLYELVWEKEEVVEVTGMENNAQKNLAASAKSDVPNSGIWIVFADQGGTGHELALRLRSQGDICWTVVTGDYFDLDRERFEVSLIPDLPDHINHLFAELNVHSGSQCKGIVHLWNLDSPELEEASLSDMHRSKRFGSHSVINIAKSLSANSGTAKFWIVTRNTQPVATEGSSLRVTAAPVWGIGRVLAQQELVEQWGGLIDLDRHADEQDAERIFGEITASASEGEIVFRGDAKYLTRIKPCSQLRPLPRTRLRKDAAYLIVGAFGALGQLVAETLIRNGARRLILASRSLLPDRDKWQDMVSDAGTRGKIEFVKHLELMGAAIHLAKIDISREAEVKTYLDEFRRKGFPPIRGVFFCAGIVKDTLLGNLDSRTFDIVYDTKVLGAYILHKYFSHEPLEHFVLFSSVAAQITTAGQANYAAGNAFLDCLAHHRRMLGLSALSINWGPWATGMIKELNLIEHYKTRRGMNCILPAVGMDIMNRILDLDQPQLIVCDANWSVVLEWYPRPPALFSGLASQGESAIMGTDTDFKTVFVMTLPEERGLLVEQKLLEIISQVLRCKPSQVESHQSLSKIGVDSILATELRNKISNSLGQMVPIVKLLSGVTIVELSGELTEKLNETTPDAASMSEFTATAMTPSVRAKNNAVLVSDSSPKNGKVIDEFPLSFGQKAIWFIHQMNPESPAYNIGGAMHIPAPLDIAALERALNEIVRRHASLRANFFLKDGEPYQRIYESREAELKIIDVEGLSWEEIRALIVRDNNKPFNIEKETLFRLRLYRQSDESYYFAVSIFHIISDAWSNYRFIDEMQRLYAEYTMGIPADLPEIQRNYSSFVEWENRLVNSIRGSGMYKYWVNNLPAEIHPLDLKTDKPRPPVQTNNGASFTFAVDKQLTSEMKELSKATGCTMFVLFLSLYHIMLHKYTQQEDIIIGSPVAGRTQPEFSDIYGYFVNPLPLRANFKNDPVFNDFVQQVRQTVLMGLDNQDYPFSLLVDRLGIEHDASRSSVFQVLFVLLNHRVEQTGMDEANVAYYKGFPMQFLQVPEEEGQFDITLSMYEENGVYQAILKYNSDLFVESTIRRMAEHFLMLTAAVVKKPNDRISDLQMLTASEIEQIINNWRGESNATLPTYDVQKIIEENASQRPNSIAVALVSEDGASDDLTYSELNARANQLAAILRRNQGNSNSTVGVYMEKSLEMGIAVLAILKAGRAFVPLDPGYPPDRIAHMLADSGAKQICSLSGPAKSLPETGAELILLDEIKDELLRESAMDTEESAGPQDIAYLIYTSGTTGIPKGVPVTRGNLYATYKAWESAYDLRAEPGAHLQMAGFSFDVFCGDYVRALCSGEKLVLCPKNVLLNIPLLYRVMRKQGIRRAEFVPSIIRNLMAYLEKEGQKADFMRLLIVGSDIWTIGELRRLKSLCGDDTRVINSYGLTEATIDSTYFEGDVSEYEDGTIVPIGKPFPGTEIYILDAHMNPVPVGIPGEICIGGQGVSTGYNNDPELTARRFVEWVPPGASKAVRLYKTGDIAQWDAKGIVQLRQRLDKQVKIRGYRVELQEIEKVMDSHPGVLKSLVRVYGKSAENQKLLAYYLANSNSEVNSAQLRDYLSHKLPGFMTPSWITEVPEFPLSMNGKVDPEKLPVPSADGADEEYLVPETMYEKKIAEIWQRVLGVANPGLRHDFFQLGGNSLHLIELMIHIQNSFKIQITVNQLLRQSSLRGMAIIVEDIATGKVEGSEPYTVYNPGRSNIVHCFPPAGGYSIVYKMLAENLDCASLISYNYLMDTHKVRKYTELIKSNQAQGPYTLFGYSLGGNMAYEIACELERMGETVSSVIIMDSYRITESFKPSESDLRLFEEELREHFKKHTGSSEVQEHTLKQARSYIDFCYDKMNRKNVQAEVHFIIENSPEDIHADYRRKSWDGSSINGTFVYSGMSRHAEMLDENYAPAHAEIIRSILDVDESKEGILTECAL